MLIGGLHWQGSDSSIRDADEVVAISKVSQNYVTIAQAIRVDYE